MFHTNYVRIVENYRCDDDCEMGGCPGHIMEIVINNTAGVGTIKNDGKDVWTIDCNQARVLLKMLSFLKNEG
jgi:hypothetical protein